MFIYTGIIKLLEHLCKYERAHALFSRLGSCGKSPNRGRSPSERLRVEYACANTAARHETFTFN